MHGHGASLHDVGYNSTAALTKEGPVCMLEREVGHMPCEPSVQLVFKLRDLSELFQEQAKLANY